MCDKKDFNFYKMINSCNNMIYIGRTSMELDERMVKHRYEYNHSRYNSTLYKNMRIIGIKKFRMVSIEKIRCSLEQSRNLEDKYIDMYNSVKNGYNSRREIKKCNHGLVRSKCRDCNIYLCEECNKRYPSISSLKKHWYSNNHAIMFKKILMGQ